MFIDTHTHIYLPEFNGDRSETIQRATQNHVAVMLMPAIDSSTHEKMMEVESEFPSCLSMIGLHPCSVNADFENELNVVNNYLERRKFIAIGEAGLDFYWDKSFVTQQYNAFHQQIELAIQFDIPIVIHSRNAVNECVEVVSQYKSVKGVFHCFSGDYRQAMKIIEMGFLLGIGGVVTFKNAGLDKVIAMTGVEHLLLETDAPYLAPVPHRGKRNEPVYTLVVAEKVAAVVGMSVEKVAELTTQNAKNLFNL